MKKIFFTLIVSVLLISTLSFNYTVEAATTNSSKNFFGNFKNAILNIFSSVFVTVSNNTSSVQVGDVNRDGRINSSDSRLALRASVGHKDSSYSALLSDLNLDGKVSSSESRVLLRKSVNLESFSHLSIVFANNALDTSNYFFTNKLYQEINDDFGDKCLGLSFVFIEKNNNLCRNNITVNEFANHISDENNGNGPIEVLEYETFELCTEVEDLSTLLRNIRTNISLGNPVILQVSTGDLVNGNISNSICSRHFVPIIGYRSDAVSKSNLTLKDFIYYDVYDGQVKILGTDRIPIKINQATYQGNFTNKNAYLYYTLVE